MYEIEITWMLVVLVLYGVGMFIWGYRVALERATEDLQKMKNELLKAKKRKS